MALANSSTFQIDIPISTTQSKKTFIPIQFRPVLRGLHLEESLQSEEVIGEHFNIKKAIERCPVILVVKDDGSQTNSILEAEHPGNTKVLYYDDLGKTWHYSFFQKKLLFYLKDRIIEPTGVYNRPFFPVTDDRKQRNLFLFLTQALEVWDAPLVGARTDNAYNGSKAYQLISSIKNAIEHSKSKISTPPSYFIKGGKHLLTSLMKKEKKLIVKSCSGIRSIVVNQKEFKKWDFGDLQNLPTLFQRQLNGHDIRVHVLGSDVWAVYIETKDAVDYRYAKHRSLYQRYELSKAQKKFCLSLQRIEKLELVGIDLIANKSRTYCLECNPGPGWAGFHRKSGDEPHLIKALFKAIK